MRSGGPDQPTQEMLKTTAGLGTAGEQDSPWGDAARRRPQQSRAIPTAADVRPPRYAASQSSCSDVHSPYYHKRRDLPNKKKRRGGSG
jgi:hypothetical protein